MKEAATEKVLPKASGFLLTEVHLSGFHDVGKRVLEQIRVHDLDVVGIRENMLPCETLNRPHKLAVGARTIRGPAPALRREKAASAEFRTAVRSWVLHRVPVEPSMRTRVLRID